MKKILFDPCAIRMGRFRFSKNCLDRCKQSGQNSLCTFCYEQLLIDWDGLFILHSIVYMLFFSLVSLHTSSTIECVNLLHKTFQYRDCHLLLSSILIHSKINISCRLLLVSHSFFCLNHFSSHLLFARAVCVIQQWPIGWKERTK